MARRICVVTGSRAEYGLLYWLMREIENAPDLELQIVVTAMHLEDAFGRTVDLIRRDGFRIDAEVPMQLASDEPVTIAKSTGLGTIGLAEAFDRLRPDIVVLLGDRFETLAAATAASLLCLPLAHIHGGEISEGAIDDAFRHAITKLSHIHFVAAEPFRQRVIQMGEQPDRVITVGAPGLDNFLRLELPDRAGLASRLGIALERPLFLITYHPATLAGDYPLAALEELLAALGRFPNAALLFTKANADAGGRAINERLEAYVAGQAERAVLIASIGHAFYLTALQEAAVVIGNSSSGIIEAPAAGTPTVNLGSRQKGRARAVSVIDCAEWRDDIAAAIHKALEPAMRKAAATGNPPYGRPGNSAGAMLEHLRKTDLRSILIKRFYDLPAQPVAAAAKERAAR